MKETDYQKKIIDDWFKFGGRCVNGQYTKAGEHDLQGGFPFEGKLYYLTVEVKSKDDYFRVMSGVREYKGKYEIVDMKKLKKHEPLQILKANQARDLGGLAVFAYNFEQVKEYCYATLTSSN